MVLIKKSEAPPELVKLKEQAEKDGLSENEAYETLRNPLKDQVRNALMCEQGHLCAYCMRRIPDERILVTDTGLSNVYIEHWTARSSNCAIVENKSLDYSNLLAVCSGNEKAPEAIRRKRRFFTCDKKRDNKPLKINPLDEETLKTINYSEDGKISSTDPDINDDLNIRLNLNCTSDVVTLPQNRKKVLDSVQAAVMAQGKDVLQNCIEQLHIWEAEDDPKTPYIGIAIWWLKLQIQAMQEG